MALAVALGALLYVALLTWMTHQQTKAHMLEAQTWRDERRELLNRIQHPTIMPARATQTVQRDPERVSANERAARAWAQVGRVSAPMNGQPADDELGDDVP